MGTARALVAGSTFWPPWRAIVSRPGLGLSWIVLIVGSPGSKEPVSFGTGPTTYGGDKKCQRAPLLHHRDGDRRRPRQRRLRAPARTAQSADCGSAPRDPAGRDPGGPGRRDGAALERKRPLGALGPTGLLRRAVAGERSGRRG